MAYGALSVLVALAAIVVLGAASGANIGPVELVVLGTPMTAATFALLVRGRRRHDV